jgi:hypothetical protein
MAVEKITGQSLVALLPLLQGQGWRVGTSWNPASAWAPIRNAEGRCPICALAHLIDPEIKLREAATASLEDLGVYLDSAATDVITRAADYSTNVHRQVLMRLLGM